VCGLDGNVLVFHAAQAHDSQHACRLPAFLFASTSSGCYPGHPMAALAAHGRFKVGLVWFLVVGVVAGWLAGVLVKGGGFGLVGDLVVGVIGAVLGGFLFGQFLGGGLIGSIVVATIGAILLLVIVRFIKRA
jgi:uncharacterized membrane protein YeaQ/YmgE (transglycosylase-associated protein family)